MKQINKKYIFIILLSIIVGLLFGWLIFGNNSSKIKTTKKHKHTSSVWTCSMHPQIRLPEFGKCPICFMDLIPVEENKSQSDESEYEIKFSDYAMKLANVQTYVVKYKKPFKSIRLSGKVIINETQIFSQTTHMGGRIEKLIVNSTGENVKKGQPIVIIYSSQLATAQEELLDAYKMKEESPRLYEAVVEKFKNWKFTKEQIDEIIKKQTIKEYFTLLADIEGVVTDLKVNSGDHLMEGEIIYTISDLKHLWILFDIYEKEIPWVKLNDIVEYTLKSFPNQKMYGKITFIDPIIDQKTRVVKARIEFNNSDLKLKPGMLVDGIVKSKLDQKKNLITVTKTAVLWTGKRSIVYVKTRNNDESVFEMREVILGPDLEDEYIIEKGLKIGEEVVINGAFSIDAAAQLAGKQNMTSLDEYNPENNENSKKNINQLIKEYIKLKDFLVKDNLKGANKSILKLNQLINSIDDGSLDKNFLKDWNSVYKISLKKAIENMMNIDDIEVIREHFMLLSENFIKLILEEKINQNDMYIQFCPMAGDDGARWISEEKQVLNPYFGSSMLKCGVMKQKIKVN